MESFSFFFFFSFCSFHWYASTRWLFLVSHVTVEHFGYLHYAPTSGSDYSATTKKRHLEAANVLRAIIKTHLLNKWNGSLVSDEFGMRAKMGRYVGAVWWGPNVGMPLLSIGHYTNTRCSIYCFWFWMTNCIRVKEVDFHSVFEDRSCQMRVSPKSFMYGKSWPNEHRAQSYVVIFGWFLVAWLFGKPILGCW